MSKTGKLYSTDAEIVGGSVSVSAENATAKITVKSTTNSAIYTSISPMYTWLYHNSNSYMRLSGYSGGSITMTNGGTQTININAVTGITTNSISSTGNISANGSATISGTKIFTDGTYSTIQNLNNGYTDITTGYAVRSIKPNRAGYMPMHASAFVVQSSKRYKIPKGSMAENEANKLLKLDVVKFDYINGDKGQYGLYAEDTISIIPECVVKDEYNRPDGIDYSKLVPFLIKKAQMQEQKINYLENTITHLIGIAMNPARVETYQI